MYSKSEEYGIKVGICGNRTGLDYDFFLVKPTGLFIAFSILIYDPSIVLVVYWLQYSLVEPEDNVAPIFKSQLHFPQIYMPYILFMIIFNIANKEVAPRHKQYGFAFVFFNQSA